MPCGGIAFSGARAPLHAPAVARSRAPRTTGAAEHGGVHLCHLLRNLPRGCIGMKPSRAQRYKSRCSSHRSSSFSPLPPKQEHLHSSSSSQSVAMDMGYVQGSMSSAELRKIRKPIIERRRRERINRCLDQIKSLVLKALNQDVSYLLYLQKFKLF